METKKSLSAIRALCWVFFLFSTVCFAAVDGAAFAGAGAVVETPGARITNVRFSASAVQFHQETDRVILDNGIVRVTFASPAGHIIGIRYKYVDNLLETENEHDNRGYWDVVWNKPGERGDFDRLAASHFRVVSHYEHQIEVSFSKKWTPRGSYSDSTVPLNFDKRYILRKGSHGIYMYTILERLEGWPDVDMDQIRVVFKLQDKLFRFMVISDDTQRVMPTMKDRTSGRALAYKEAVLLTHPANPALRGEVDDKYQYSCEDQDNKVHGWISESQRIGFWMITPSDEFRVGGPVKQDLTSHAGPTVLNMFTSTHYAGKDMNTEYRNGEPWKKVLGPVFVYMNSGRTSMLWREAKKQMRNEVRSWPYGFVSSEDFPSEQERGTVFGQLFLRDRYVNDNKLAAAGSAYVGLAAPGEEGSWQTDAKGYQFWTRADEDGKFSIEHIRPGNYSLYGWVPGVIGENMYKTNITILPGSKIDIGRLVYHPPRNGPTLWEIGIPDRKADEFHVPDAYPALTNRLYINRPTDRFRQYGLWSRYTDLYPRHDLVYKVGVSNFFEDWFYAHVPRHTGHNTLKPTTWEIKFDIPTVDRIGGDYTLQLALASAAYAEVQVRFNDWNPRRRPLFTTGLIGKDNAIARHGIHGLYWLFTISVPSRVLVDGKNSVYLTQTRTDAPFTGVMYDYIRLEGPKGKF